MMFEEAAARNKQRRKMSMNDKRRFSDEQIRCLELMFESDTKLEPRKKVEVAKSLGLQPRQVAIWFQNKRARWKSKHLEKEYASLLSSYNDLAARFESLKKEKQALLLQLEKLKKENEKESDGESESNNSSNNNDKSGIIFEVKSDDDIFVEEEEEGRRMMVSSEWLQQQQQQQVSEEEEELLRMVDTSDWGSLDSDDIIINDHITSDDQWWGFSSFVD